MARPKAIAPARRFHISGQSVVTIDGKDFYLGKHDTAESIARYAVLIAAYQANGLKLPEDFKPEAPAGVLATMPTNQADAPILVRHVTSAYREHVKKRYANSKSDLARYLSICSDIESYDGDRHAEAYGPKALAMQRERWVESGKCRRYCNTLTNSAIRMFKWAVAEELVAVSIVDRLRSIEPLREGQTDAKESQPVKPVKLEHVRATAKELSPILRSMLRIHVATGMRPSELCTMRPCDIDRSGSEWMYRPAQHKNKRRGKTRAIPILGDAKEALIDYMNRDPQAYCFSPSESVSWWQAAKRAARKTKVQPSQVDRSKGAPEVKPGERYTQDSYRRAIARAAKRAGVPQWFPYQLRHLNLTEVRDAIGVEHAQALGGHSRIDMTEVYAKLSEKKAIEAARHAPTL